MLYENHIHFHFSLYDAFSLYASVKVTKIGKIRMNSMRFGITKYMYTIFLFQKEIILCFTENTEKVAVRRILSVITKASLSLQYKEERCFSIFDPVRKQKI